MRELPITGVIGHSINSTVNNIGFAWHVSWPWMLAILPFNIVGNVYATLNQPATPEDIDPMVALVSFGLAILTMVAFASIAVNWHRYILLDEVPHGMERLRLDGLVWRYVGNTILMLLMLILGGMLVAAVLGLLMAGLVAALGKAGGIIVVPGFIALACAIIVYSYRLGIKLPAVALGRRDYRFRNALDDSAGNFWRFFGLGLLVALIMLLIGLIVFIPTYFLAQMQNKGVLAVLIAVQLVVNWVATIWTVTMLTSLYGYFAEKRNF